MSPVALLLCICLGGAAVAVETSLYPYIYADERSLPCVRLLNQEGTLGCQAKSTGAVLYGINTTQQLDAFLSDTSLNGQYAVMIPFLLATSDTFTRLERSNRMASVLVTPSRIPEFYSPTSTIPNRRYGLYANSPAVQHEWNPHGMALDEQSFTFPMAQVHPDDLEAFTFAANYNAQRGHKSYPLYAAGLDNFMYAADSSQDCLRRITCDPVGGNSVWGTLMPVTENDTKDIILISVPMDSSSLFHDVAPGADADTSAVVAALAAAKALGAHTAPSTFTRHVMFGLWDGEAWGYAGSQRFVKEIQSFTCTKPAKDPSQCERPYKTSLKFTNIKFSRFSHIIHMTQLAGLADISQGVLFTHIDDRTVTESVELAELLESVANSTVDQSAYGAPFVRSAFATTNLRLPPSSLMSFLKVNPQLPGVVLSDFKTEYSNPYYHSSLDNADLLTEVNYKTICDAATVVARTAYLLANDLSDPTAVPPELVADCAFVNETLDCLLTNFSCPLVSSFLDTGGIEEQTQYAGVFQFGYIGAMSKYLRDQLATLIATSRGADCSDDAGVCNADNGEACIGGQCIVSNVYWHDAYGTGIEFDYDARHFKVVDPTQASYTESQWQATHTRLYLVESPGSELGVLFGGFGIFVLFLVGILVGTRYIGDHLKQA